MAGEKKKAVSTPVGSSGSRRAPQVRARFSSEHQILLSLLVEARHKAGLSQAALAKKLGKAKSHVALIEMRDRDITTVETRRWCEAVGTSFLDCARMWEEAIQAARLEAASRAEEVQPPE